MSLMASPSLRLPVDLKQLAGLSRYARPALLALLTVFIAWRLADLTWLVLPRAPEPVRAPVPGAVQGTAPARSVNAESLAQLHLFGHAEQAATQAVVAPTTDLALTLRGVWAFPESSKRASAIIEAQGEQNVFFVGERLPGGNATLKSVLPDRIILDRGGRLETLYLVQEGDASSISLVPVAAPASGKGAGREVNRSKDVGLQASLRELRQTAAKSPLSLMKLISGQPATDEHGQTLGFRVAPGENGALFARAGLRKGDIVTAVNGVSLADPSQLPAVMQQLQGAQNLNIRVRRGSEELALLLSLGDAAPAPSAAQPYQAAPMPTPPETKNNRNPNSSAEIL